MAENSIKINWLIKAQDEASKVMASVDNNAKRMADTLDKIDKSMAGFNKQVKDMPDPKKSFGGVGAAIIVTNQALELTKKVLGPVVDLMAEAINQAIEQERAEVLLAFALKEKGLYTKQNYEANLRLADSISRITTFQDDQILGVQKTLTIYGVSQKRMAEVTKATIDYAVANKKDLATAADTVGRSIGTMSNGLGRAGVKLGEVYDIGQRTNMVLQGLSRYSGAAEAETNTFGGALAQTKNSWQQLLGTIGSFITQSPFIVQMIKEIGKAFGSMQDYIIKNKGSIQDFIQDGLMLLIDALQATLDASKSVKNFLGFEDVNDKKIKTLEKSILAYDHILKTSGQNSQEVKGIINELLEQRNKLYAKKQDDPFAKVITGLEKLKGKIGGIKDPFEKFNASPNSLKEANELTKELLAKYPGLDLAQAKFLEGQSRSSAELQNQIKYQQAAIQAAEGLNNAQKIELSIYDEKNKVLQDQMKYQEMMILSKSKEIDLVKKIRGEEEARKKVAQATYESWIAAAGKMAGLNLGQAEAIAGGLQSGGAGGAKSALTGALNASGDPYAMAAAKFIEIFGKGQEEFKKSMTEFFTFFEELPGMLADNLVVFIDILIEKLPIIMEKMNEMVPRAVQNLLDLMSTERFWKNVANALVATVLGSLMGKINKLVVAIQTALVAAMPVIIQSFMTTFTDPEYIGQIVNAMVQGVVDSMVLYLTQPIFWLQISMAIVSGFIPGFAQFFSNIKAQMQRIFSNVGQWIASGLSKIFDIFRDIANVFSGIVGGLTGVLGYVSEILNMAKDILSGGGVGSAIGGGGGDIIGAIGDVFGFQSGGIIKALQRAENGLLVGGSSYSGDNTLIRANAGEMVLNKDQQRNLFDMINQGSKETPQTIVVNLTVGKDKLAETILTLSKEGYRLA